MLLLDWLDISLLATTSIGLLTNRDKVMLPKAFYFGNLTVQMTFFEDLDIFMRRFILCIYIFTCVCDIWKNMEIYSLFYKMCSSYI